MFSKVGAIVILMSGLIQGATAQGSKTDYDRALNLHKQFRGKLSIPDIHAAWSPDEDFVIYRTGKKLLRLDLKTTKESPAVNMAGLAGTVGAKHNALNISNHTIAPDKSLWLLVKRQKSMHVVKQPVDGKMESVALDTGHPFRGSPVPARQTRSRRRGRGAMTICLVNRSGGPVQSYWVTTSGERKPYQKIADGATVLQGTHDGHAWLFTDENKHAVCGFIGDRLKPIVVIKRSQKTEKTEKRRDPWTSPDGKYKAFIKDHNVYLREVKAKKETQLSKDGTKDNRYVRPDWSPDSTRLIVIQRKEGQRHTVHIVESTPKDQLQPKLHSFNYLKPGDQIKLEKPRLFDVQKRKQIPVSDKLSSTPWSIWHQQWSNDGKEFFFTYNQRGHQVLRVVAVNAATGKTRTVVEEKTETFICYSSKTWCHHLDDTDELIWMSERDGWNHLYLIDRKRGKVKKQITKGNWVVRGVHHVDDEKRELVLKVMGVHKGQDPYHEHIARVNFDGTDFKILTAGDGTHTIEFSPKQNFIIDTYSRVDLGPVTELRNATTGNLVKALAQTDLSKLTAAGWRAPEPFVAKGRDGKTKIYGIIRRPSNFDPKKKYPVIEAIYAGPHGQHVPKSFSVHVNPLAELGFIVVQIDGMGTNWRSKAFHDVCWKNLGDAGFPDRKAWIRAAAKKYPYMDITRVGIYGGSAGGQNAMRALIDHHDFYKVAVADCGCHDNRMDKIWWNEQWMGWPIDKAAYDKSSNSVQAHKMKGHLMLTVGELDKNVDPASTMQVVNALIKADKDFDLIVFPGAGHGAGGSPYGRRRMWDFFVRHLHNKEPRWK